MNEFNTDDIRAAVSTNILTEAQAANFLALVQTRQGTRGHLPQEDEPFEFFRGFSEIFVTVGLTLLFAGIIAFSAFIGGEVITLALGAGLCLFQIHRQIDRDL